MPLRVEIEDGRFGTRDVCGVTSRGQLITAPLEFNSPLYQSLNVANQAFNFVKPCAGKQFVIDGLIFSSDKNISTTNGAVIQIYEADGLDQLASSQELFRLDVGKLDKGSLTGLNVITNAGVWINAKTDTATCNVTILGYFVDVI